MALDAREMNQMRNLAAGSRFDGYADQAIVAEFVALVPDAKRGKIAEALYGQVQAGAAMQHRGQTLTLATMAAIAVELGS